MGRISRQAFGLLVEIAGQAEGMTGVDELLQRIGALRDCDQQSAPGRTL
jgi:hypothetical protein